MREIYRRFSHHSRWIKISLFQSLEKFDNLEYYSKNEVFLMQDLSSQNLSISEIAKQIDFDRKNCMEIPPAKTLPETQKNPGRKRILILSNLVFLRNLIKLNIILFYSIEKSTQLILERKNYI